MHLLNHHAHTSSSSNCAGSLEELRDRYQRTHRGWLRGDILPNSTDALRAYLFFWFRADRHSGAYGPHEEELVWLSALLDAMRRSLSTAG